jgi:hypothetical protein
LVGRGDPYNFPQLFEPITLDRKFVEGLRRGFS